jgi:hypothetical protein
MTDPFLALPTELLHVILAHLPSSSIASLRLATRTVRQLPIVLFRRLLLEDMPWFWEANDLPVGETNWWGLYILLKFCWADGLKGLKNRKRIWKDVNEIVSRIESYRAQDMIRRWLPTEFANR